MAVAMVGQQPANSRVDSFGNHSANDSCPRKYCPWPIGGAYLLGRIFYATEHYGIIKLTNMLIHELDNSLMRSFKFFPTRPSDSLRHVILRRRGVTTIELVVSAMLLMAVMTFVTTLCFRINLVWKDIGHHRVAVGELSNQLESLQRMTPAEAQAAVESLEPSLLCRRTLRDPELEGELIADELGNRIVLQINWARRNPGQPIELAAWLATETDSNEEGQP